MAGKVAATVSAHREPVVGSRHGEIESKHEVRRKVREAQAQANRERLKRESEIGKTWWHSWSPNRSWRRSTGGTLIDTNRYGWKQTSAARNSDWREPVLWRGCVTAASPSPASRRSVGAARKLVRSYLKELRTSVAPSIGTRRAGTVRKH